MYGSSGSLDKKPKRFLKLKTLTCLVQLDDLHSKNWTTFVIFRVQIKSLESICYTERLFSCFSRTLRHCFAAMLQNCYLESFHHADEMMTGDLFFHFWVGCSFKNVPNCPRWHVVFEQNHTNINDAYCTITVTWTEHNVSTLRLQVVL